MDKMLKLMLGRDSEDEIDQDLCLNLRYELNPRVRCAFGNVFFYKSAILIIILLLLLYLIILNPYVSPAVIKVNFS